MIARNSNSPPPPTPTTMLAQTMVIGPQTNIVNGEGGKLGIFWKVYELISMIVVGRYIFTDTSKREGGGIIFPGYGKAGSQNIIP
jgi:hypothetical protein